MSEPNERPSRCRADVRQQWVERMQRFEQSGLSVVAFCHKEQVSSQSFYYWKHKLLPHPPAPDPAAPRLLPVSLLGSAPVEIVLPTGAVLRLAPGCDLAFVRSLLAALGDHPC